MGAQGDNAGAGPVGQAMRGECPSAPTLPQTLPKEQLDPLHSPSQFRALLSLEMGEQVPCKKAGSWADS